MQNALRGVTGSSGGGEKGKTRRREGERERDREDSRKRKRSALDEIRDVRYWSSWLHTVLLYIFVCCLQSCVFIVCELGYIYTCACVIAIGCYCYLLYSFQMEEQRKEKMNRRDNWITEVHCTVTFIVLVHLLHTHARTHALTHTQGIVVKVVHKKLYYKQKGVVEGVQDQYTGVVRMLETGDKVKFDQAHLETVLPAIGIYSTSVYIGTVHQCR